MASVGCCRILVRVVMERSPLIIRPLFKLPRLPSLRHLLPHRWRNRARLSVIARRSTENIRTLFERTSKDHYRTLRVRAFCTYEARLRAKDLDWRKWIGSM